MTKLTVNVSGSVSESRLLTLPVDVYAPDGSILVSGTASPENPGKFEVAEQRWARVHVRGKLPNGSSVQQTVALSGGTAEATLRLGDESPNEWLQWVTPFRSLGHLQSSTVPDVVGSRRIGKVWMTLWSMRDGRWEAQGLEPLERQRGQGMQQLVIDVPEAPHLLQVGGEEVAWRLVSLPPGGLVRVAMTRSVAAANDAIEITIGRKDPDNELIMSYLARGAVAEAGRLAEAWEVADQLLFAKIENPVSAAAGAYVLLKNRRLQDRSAWVDNLVKWFPYMADGPIVAAALALQRAEVRESEIRSLIYKALDRGLPIFAMGVEVLVETMAAVHRGKNESKRFHAAYLAAQAYARAHCSRGAYFTFYGKSPAEPTWTPLYGQEGHAIARRGGTEELSDVTVSTKPMGGIPSGKFGRTRVVLPRAPISEWGFRKLQETRHRHELTVSDLLARQLSGMDGLFSLNVENPSASNRTQRFESDFSTSFVRSPFPQDTYDSHLSRHEVVQPRITGTPAGDKSVKSPQRKTSKYWREERLNNAMTIFDGDE